MCQFFVIHPDNPQERLIKEAVKIIHQGGVVVFPTDSAYAIGCHLADKQALDRIRTLRHLDETHYFTLICRDLSELGTYSIVDNAAFRLIKANTPGPYTFILPASREVPKRLLHPKRKTIGLRVPKSKITLALLEELKEPLMSVTLIAPDRESPFEDAQDIFTHLGRQVDVIIDGGICYADPTTVVELGEGAPNILRYGKGDPTAFL